MIISCHLPYKYYHSEVIPLGNRHFHLGKSSLASFDYLGELPPTFMIFLPENNEKRSLIVVAS